MKSFLFALAVTSLLLYAPSVIAQEQSVPVLISGEFNDVGADEFFQFVRTQYQVRFSYDAGAMKEIRVNRVFAGEELESCLFHILEEKGYTFRKVGATYLIVPLRDSHERPDQGGMEITLSGVVQDAESGEPLPYANIFLKGTKRSFTSDYRGEFIIDQIPSDTAMLTFSYVGYERKTVRIKTILRERDGVVQLRITRNILPEAIVEGKGLSPVTSGDQPGLIVINPQSLGSVNGPGEPDIFRTAQLIPGVNATNEMSNGLIIRGSPGDQSLIQIDGFTVYHMDHFFGVISAINPLAVKNIRVQKGGVEVRNASRIGGLVDITAKEGNRYQAGGKLVAGPLSLSGYLETPLNAGNNMSLMIAARRSTTDFWNSPTYNELFKTIYNASIRSEQSTSPGDEAEYLFSDVISKITWRPSVNDVLFVSGYTSRDQLGIAYDAMDNAGAYSYKYYDDSEWGNRGAGVGWSHKYSERWKQDVTAGWSKYASDLNAVDTLIDLRFQDVQRFYREDNNTLIDMNTRYQLEHVRSNHTFYAGAMVNSVDIQRSGSETGVNSASHSRATWSSAFAQWKSSRNDFRWNAGLRSAFYTGTKQWYPEWSVSMIWGKPDSISFKASVARVHQFVHRLRQQSLFLNQPDTWMLGGVQNIPVLAGDQFILGVWVPLVDWQLDIEGYVKKNRGVAMDIGQWYWQEDNTSQVATGTGSTIGFDIFLKRERTKSDFWISYSLANSGMQFSALDLSNNLVPGYEHLHEVKVYYEWKWKRWNIWATWVYGSGRPYTPLLGETSVETVNGSIVQTPVYGELNSARLKPYHRLDAGAGYRIEHDRHSWNFVVNLTNVYNRVNIRDIQYLSYLRGDGTYTVTGRNIEMIGFIPSFQIAYSF